MKAKFLNGLKSMMTKLGTAISRVFDGMIVTLTSVASNPVKLAFLVLFGFVVFDIIMVGKVGIISYIFAQCKLLFDMLATLKTSVLIFIAFMGLLIFVNKK